MNWDQVEGQWKVLKGSVREKWGKLTDQDFESIGGKKDQFLGKLQERYGMAKESAERELDDFIANTNAGKSSPRTTNSAVTNNSVHTTKKSNDPSSVKLNIDVQKH